MAPGKSVDGGGSRTIQIPLGRYNVASNLLEFLISLVVPNIDLNTVLRCFTLRVRLLWQRNPSFDVLSLTRVAGRASGVIKMVLAITTAWPTFARRMAGFIPSPVGRPPLKCRTV
jgi:hypothetical protein